MAVVVVLWRCWRRRACGHRSVRTVNGPFRIRPAPRDRGHQHVTNLVRNATRRRRCRTMEPSSSTRCDRGPPLAGRGAGFKRCCRRTQSYRSTTPLTLTFVFEVGAVTATVTVTRVRRHQPTDATSGTRSIRRKIRHCRRGRNVVDLLQPPAGVVKTDIDASESGGYDDHRSAP